MPKASDIPPIPTILVGAGIACIILGITGGISGKYVVIVPSLERQLILVVIGIILFVLGLYFFYPQNKIAKGIKETGDTNLREAERIATDFIKGKVNGSKIKILETKLERGFYKIEGTTSSPSGVVKYFTVEIDTKTKNVQDYVIEDSPWSV